MPQNSIPLHWLASYDCTMPTVPESAQVTQKISPASHILKATSPPSGGYERKSMPKPAPHLFSPPPTTSRYGQAHPLIVPASVTGNDWPSAGVMLPAGVPPSKIGGSE